MGEDGDKGPLPSRLMKSNATWHGPHADVTGHARSAMEGSLQT